MHVDAETEEDAVSQFFDDIDSSDVTLDIRDIASGEDAVDAVKLTYVDK